jgi:hypothetical protein
MNNRRNTETTGLIVGLVMLLAGGGLALWPNLANSDMMQSGYALMCLGGFLALCGVVTSAVYGDRVARLSAMLAGRQVLAHWVYETAQVDRQAARDFKETKERNRGIFLVIAFFMLACIILFTIIGFVEGEEDSMPGFIAFMLVILLVIAAFAFGMPYLQRRQTTHSSHEAYIATNGLYVNGALHTWNSLLAKLDSVAFADRPEPRLVFNLRSLSSVGWIHYEPYAVEVPVPRGQEEEARRTAQRLSSRKAAHGSVTA